MISKTIDYGKTCGIYLISLGAILFFSMIFRGMLLKRLDLDLFFLIFFMAGYFLTKHNNTARKWVIVISLIFVIAVFVFAIIIPFTGTENIIVNLLLYRTQGPALAVAYFALFVVLIFTLIPIMLLYNDKARQEFKK